jgi:5-methylcytosine-specific restriction enzyme subunit McrC
MAHYQPLRPWCELVLYQQMPLSLAGAWHGISMLFSMERLFERYVTCILRKSLVRGARLVAQPSRYTLCQPVGNGIFALEPDIFIEQGLTRWVIDAKWKRLDAGDRSNRYGLSSSDFYQMFAYGEKYLGGQGEIYSSTLAEHSLRPHCPCFATIVIYRCA